MRQGLKPGPQQEVAQVQVIDETARAADLDGQGVGRQVPVHVRHGHHGGHESSGLVIGPAQHFIEVAGELAGDRRIGHGGNVLAEGAGLYADAARSLAETGRCRVILCARPEEFREHGSEPPVPGGDDAESQEEAGEPEIGRDFHDMLKAQALGLACPLQVMRRETWEGTVRRSDPSRPLQDEATRAWNLHIALYYKAGGTPGGCRAATPT